MLTNNLFILLSTILVFSFACKRNNDSISNALKQINNADIVVKILREGVLQPKGQEPIASKTQIDSLKIDTLPSLITNSIKSHIVSVHSLSDSLIPSCLDGLGVDSYITFTINNRLLKISFMCEQYGNAYLYDYYNNTNYKVTFTVSGKDAIEKTIQSIRKKME